MVIECSREGSVTVVTVAGRMDALTSPAFEKKLNELIVGGETRFAVDMAGLDYISSAGLRGILAAAKLLKGKGGQISFANVEGAVREVFDISGFGTIFRICDSVAGALAGFK